MLSDYAMCAMWSKLSWLLENLSTCEGGEAIDGSEDGGEDVAEDDTEECGSRRGWLRPANQKRSFLKTSTYLP